MRSERDGSHVHTREFESAFRAVCAAKGINFAVVSPELVMPAVQLLVPNIQMPLMMGNKMMEGAMVQAAEQEQMAVQEEAMAQEQGIEEKQMMQPQM